VPLGHGCHVERLGLATGSIQGQHQLGLEPLPEGVRRDEVAQLADEIPAAADREICLNPVLERREPKLLEPRDRQLCEWLEGEIRKRGAAPE
jgi:hypothetical protein